MCAFPTLEPPTTVDKSQGNWAQCLEAVWIFNDTPATPKLSLIKNLLYSCGSDHGLPIWYIFQQHDLAGRIESKLRQEKGGFNIMRYGAGPSGPMRTLGQYMLGSGVTFG